MSPAIAIAKELYDRQGLKFEAALAHYLNNGYVFSEPERLIMGAPCNSESPDHIAFNGSADCWYVHLAVGKGALQWFINHMPWYLPKVCWRRQFKVGCDDIHIWPTDRLISKLRA